MFLTSRFKVDCEQSSENFDMFPVTNKCSRCSIKCLTARSKDKKKAGEPSRVFIPCGFLHDNPPPHPPALFCTYHIGQFKGKIKTTPPQFSDGKMVRFALCANSSLFFFIFLEGGIKFLILFYPRLYDNPPNSFLRLFLSKI